MGQLFKRILNFAKSELTSRDDVARAEEVISNYDELNREFEKLKNETPPGEKKNDDYVNHDAEVKRALETLGLGANAGKSEIKAAYRKKVAENHPDKSANLGKSAQDAANKKMADINSAYEILKMKARV